MSLNHWFFKFINCTLLIPKNRSYIHIFFSILILTMYMRVKIKQLKKKGVKNESFYWSWSMFDIYFIIQKWNVLTIWPKVLYWKAAMSFLYDKCGHEKKWDNFCKEVLVSIDVIFTFFSLNMLIICTWKSRQSHTVLM